jgi:hypothetical protein
VLWAARGGNAAELDNRVGRPAEVAQQADRGGLGAGVA